MKFQQIKEDSKVFPGEYLLHLPTRQIVMCGAFKRQEGQIKALVNGRLIEDKIDNFQKIHLNKKDHHKKRNYRSCGGCKK